MGGFNDKMDQVTGKLRGVNGYILGDFNADLIKSGTHAPTSEFLGGLTARGFYPLVSLPSRITDTTATLIDNIFTNNVDCQIASGLVTVRVSDHLPVYAFVGGAGSMREEGGPAGRRRVVNQERVRTFAQGLVEWDWRALRSLSAEENAARFGDEFRDLYDRCFPVARRKRRRKDVEKPWLDDPDFKQLVDEKGDLYSRKLRGRLTVEGEVRLREVQREVNGARQRFKRAFFGQRVREAEEEMRASWEVLREVIGRGKGRHIL